MSHWLLKQVRSGDHVHGNMHVITRRNARSVTALVLLASYMTGCFHYVPAAQSSLPAGAEVAVDVTDRGRMELSETIGPGARRIDGNVLVSNDTSIVLAVSSVSHLDLPVPVQWAGERVELSRSLISGVRVRTMSRSRTLITGGLVVAGIVVASLVALTGFGSDDGGGGTRPEPEPPVGQ